MMEHFTYSNFGLKVIIAGSPEAKAVLKKLEVGSRMGNQTFGVAEFQVPARVFKSIRPDSEFVSFICEDKGNEWWLLRILSKYGETMRIDTRRHWAIRK